MRREVEILEQGCETSNGVDGVCKYQRALVWMVKQEGV